MTAMVANDIVNDNRFICHHSCGIMTSVRLKSVSVEGNELWLRAH